MKRTKVVLALCFLFLVLSASSKAKNDEASKLFYQGNAQYQGEKFEEAVHSYEGALRTGFESANLYYNLGNAYFKIGDLGRAIINYMRAKEIAPHDADINSNLEYARSMIKERVPEPEKRWFSRAFLNMGASMSLDTATVLSSAIYFVLSLLLIAAVITKNLNNKAVIYTIIILSILLAAGVGILARQFVSAVIEKKAVVIAEEAPSKFEPLENATTYFVLYEGEDVIVTKTETGWIKVRRRDGKQGWIERDLIELL